MEKEPVLVDVALAHRLIATQFPQWQDLWIRPVACSGWDNRSFHLGDHMLIRMPSSAEYASQVEKEHLWLPRLSPLLPLSIPEPLGKGNPGDSYPWKWSIYRWLEGDSAAVGLIDNLKNFAKSLAQFLSALQQIDAKDGPIAGPHSFYRGGLLDVYDLQVRKAAIVLKDKIDIKAVMAIWEEALATSWSKSPVWVHGDISPGNLLVHKGILTSVIDFGQLSIGDPACDLAIAWTLLKGESREIFKETLLVDSGTWTRGRAWALWKALITVAGFTNPHNFEAANSRDIMEEILNDYRSIRD